MQKAQLAQGILVGNGQGTVPSKGTATASGMLSTTHKAISATGKVGNSGKQNAAKGAPLSKFLLAESARHNPGNASAEREHHQLQAQIQ